MDRKIKEEKVRNKKAVLAGTAFFVISIFYLSELFQFFIASKFLEANLYLSTIFPKCEFLVLNSNNLVNFFGLFADLFFVLLTVEIAYHSFKKLPLGFWRYSILLFIVFSLGFVILTVFYGFYSAIIPNSQNDWVTFFSVMQSTIEEKIIYSLGFVLTTFLYLNLITRRLIKYIKT